jgi:hypothetical protein
MGRPTKAQEWSGLRVCRLQQHEQEIDRQYPLTCIVRSSRPRLYKAPLAGALSRPRYTFEEVDAIAPHQHDVSSAHVRGHKARGLGSPGSKKNA